MVLTRALRYPRDWPDQMPQEKGIDVQLAVDVVRGYALDEFDIAVIASTDTDLVPALEAVLELDRGRGYAPVEVCSWFDDSYSKQLRVTGHDVYCHEFPAKIFNRVADNRDYNIP